MQVSNLINYGVNMQHHLYKEPQAQDAIEYEIEAQKPRSEMSLTLIIALSFTAGLVTAFLSAVFARIV